MKIRSLKILFCLFFLTFQSCDFTPKIHKEILSAQRALKQQDLELAIKKYNQILGKNPDSEIKLKIYYQLGEIYSLNLGEYSRAIEYFNLVQNVANEPIWLIRAKERIGEISFIFLKDYPLSIKSYTNLLEYNPKLSNFDFYQYRKALSYFYLNEYESAFQIFKLISTNRDNQFHKKSFFHMGHIFFEKQNWEKAIEYWNQYLTYEDGHSERVQTKFLIANSHERKEDLQTAYNIYYSILDDYPNAGVVQKRLNSIIDRRAARKR